MNEVKSPKKPLLYYYVLVMLVLLLFNLLAMPWISEHQIKEVDYNTFVSMEPLLQPFEGVGAQAVKKVGWCIIGAMTGPGSKAHQPKREWVESIVTDAKTAGVPVFMKDNLKGVWEGQLLRECPEGIDLADKKAVAEWDGE